MTTLEDHGIEAAEQAAFRAEARAFLHAHLPPRRDANPWALNFTADEREARAHFEAGRAWQRLLFDNGFARIDSMGIGLDSTNNCALIDASGEPSTRIFAIGPLTRAAFWEIVAVPDIRAQCHRLTVHICAQLHAA